MRRDRARRFSSVATFMLPLSMLALGDLCPAAAQVDDLPQVPGITLRGAADPPPAIATPPAEAPGAAAEVPSAPQKKSAGEKAEKKKPASKAAGDDEPAPAAEKTAAVKPDAKPRRSGSSIAVLVNDEPITGYEIEQRASFIALSSGGGGDMKAKAEARWQSIIKNPKTNERFKQLLKDKGVSTQEEARSVQAQFVKDLQRDMLEQLRREARKSAVAGSKTKAQDELIDEKLKLQEAKKLSVVASEDEVDKIIGGIAERNKMTLKQFGDHMKGMGVDISTMRSRFMAEISWREVIRRRFGHQISITDRDVDKVVAMSSGGEDDVELQLQRISVFTPPKADQKMIAQKLAEAQTLAGRFTSCKDTRELTTQLAGARFDDLGNVRPTKIPEPTRSMVLNTPDGNMLPPIVGETSIELWIVCGRKTVTASEQMRETAQAELRQKEFEIMARKHLKDLRQDAAIEYR